MAWDGHYVWTQHCCYITARFWTLNEFKVISKLAKVDFTKDLNVDTESKKLILRMADMDH